MSSTEVAGGEFDGFQAAGSSEPLSRDHLIRRYAREERGAQWLRANFVSSIDGAVTRDGRSGGLGTAPDHVVFELLRMLADVVIVGAGTIRTEGYDGLRVSAESSAWRLANGLPAHPPLAIVSSRLDLDPDSAIFAGAPVRPFVITHESSPRATRDRLSEVSEVIVAGETAVDLAAATSELAARGLTQMLSEGGPRLLGSLIDADLLDELCLTLSPTLEGGDAGRIVQGAAARPHPLRLAHALTAADTLLLRYTR